MIILQETTNPKEFEKAVESEMDKQLKHFERELVKIRTGRAQTGMIEDLRVACYGSLMPLKDVASISAPEPTLLIVQAWDVSIIAEIEKAIATSDLGVVPQTDGALIRIPLPRMSGARRDELVKVLHKKVEEARVAVRNVRKDFHNILRDAERTKKVSEDLCRRLTDSLQKVTDKFIDTLEKASNKKEDEIRQL